MKANEVRIRNIVSYKNKAYKIYSISNDYPFLDSILDSIEFEACVVEWKDLQPIEIYELFLLQNGFEKITKEYETRFTKMDFVIVKFKNENHYTFQGWRALPVTLMFVHQLQNLYYSLVGSELTIV